jgi:hypothetical protein
VPNTECLYSIRLAWLAQGRSRRSRTFRGYILPDFLAAIPKLPIAATHFGRPAYATSSKTSPSSTAPAA